MTERIRLYAYSRVSTPMQVVGGNLENQRRSISRFIKNNDNKYEVVRWFEDQGISAFKDRPAYDRMMTLLLEGGADGVVVVRLDRIGRSVKQISTLLDILDSNSKKFIATEQNIETNTMEGRLLTNILIAIAEFEVNCLKKGLKRGENAT